MGELLTGGSVLAAFFAGGVALFAPCCIVFLLPSYLAASVKNRRWRLLPLTFVFAAGLALVLLPITLGVRLVASSLTAYHAWLYAAGGILLLSLAVLAVSGRTWSLPTFLRAPDPERGDSAGIFALGVFSGVASSCCAPVLAGVLTLSALSSSPAGASVLGLAYVFGMTFPLFVMALAWDRWNLGDRRLFQAKPVDLHVAGRHLETNTVNLIVAAVFALMGGFVLTLAVTGETTAAPGAQLAIGRWLGDTFDRLLLWLEPVPEPVLGGALLALAAAFVIAALRDRRTSERSTCHDHHGAPHELEASSHG
jgi:cytochrome c biogenesis protein CcdA